jgi:hypothetical protein
MLLDKHSRKASRKLYFFNSLIYFKTSLPGGIRDTSRISNGHQIVGKNIKA